MAPRGSQPSNFKTKQRQKRISDLKARIAALEKQTSGKGGFRNKNRISQLKKKLRDMNAGYQKITPTNTKKKLVKTSRGLKIRNVAQKPKKKYNDGKMSNIPAGEATVNNPNFGKPGNFKEKPKEKKKDEGVTTTDKKSKVPSFTESVEASKKGALGDNKGKKDKPKSKETKRYGRAPKGYIKAGNKFASLKSVKGKRAKMKADRLKILQDKIKKNKKKKVDG